MPKFEEETYRKDFMVTHKRALLCILFLFFSLALVMAAGNPEKGLPKVDRLIKERNYNEAILELSLYMKENPEDFDGAQQRIRRIIKMRNEYNQVASNLVSVLENEPTNDQKKLDLIAFLESLEKNPNEATRQFIEGTKSAAQFTFYRARFNEIMDGGNALIDAGRYLDAARTFTQGYVFYKEDFDAESDPVLVQETDNRLGIIQSALLSWASIETELAERHAAVKNAVIADSLTSSSTVASLLPPLSETLQKFSAVRNRTVQAGWFFEDTFTGMQNADQTLTDNAFLPFAQRFTLGRKTIGRYEGVVGAMDARWNAIYQEIEDTVYSRLDLLWRNTVRAASDGTPSGYEPFIREGERLAEILGPFLRSAALLERRPDTFGQRLADDDALALAASGTYFRSYQTLAGYNDQWEELEKRIAAVAVPEPQPSVLRNSSSPVIGEWNTLIASLQSLESRRQNLNSTSERDMVKAQWRADYDRLNETLRDNLSSGELSLHRASAQLYFASTSSIRDEWAREFERGSALFAGIQETGDGITRYYPAESIEVFNRLRRGIQDDRARIVQVVGQLERSQNAIRSDSVYSASISGMQSLVAVLDRLFAEAGDGITRANSRVLQANLARQEADLRFNQADAALRRGDFQSARDNLQRSRERINVSLSFQESPQLRRDTDARIERLGNEITRTENEAVVREVRALITSGRNLYFQGNIDQAEQVFFQANARWRTTNIEPNAEISNWLEIINTALSMKTGRTIPVSAPLYPQMSQLLNNANQLYIEGAELLRTGRRSEGIAILGRAKDLLRQLQLVYPLNQDAGQLTLKIDQIIDPQAFTVFFRQRVESIRTNYRSERQTAYSELLDLYQINPSYPGLSALVTQVEIFLGIRIPPPDPAALARSRELTSQAQRIFDGQNRSLFEVALQQLDEAIKLNPDNQVAVNLKDRVQTSIGGQSVAVLSAEDEQRYQQAVQELQRGNTINAAALVQQLMQNPKSRNSAKIQDLKKRIDSLL